MSPTSRVFRVGTRTSRLARIQTDLFLEALRAHSPQTQCEVVGVTTHGDRVQHIPIPDLGQGVFVKELEIALVNNEIDIAVHSLKDLPTELPPGLTLAAVLTREDPRDALVSRNGWTLETLPQRARVGTGSPRRGAQVLARRPDLQIVLLRGNVDTRVRKVLEDGEVEAAVLAAAGLVRLKMENLVTQYFEPDQLLPAIGQGFLAIECRASDAETLALLALTQDTDARRASAAERAFLASVGGGCKAPLGAYATASNGALSLEGMVASSDGRHLLRERVTGNLTPYQAGNLVKERLFARGAGEIIAVEDRAAAERAETSKPEASRRETPQTEISGAPLSGLRVVVTRPEERGSDLVRRLTELGAKVHSVPAIAFRVPDDLVPLDTALASLERFDWTIFTSATAVEFCLRRLAVLGRPSFQGLRATRLAAVGPATAQVLERHGLQVHLVPHVHTTEGLLQELALLLAGQRVFLPRADIADSAFPQGLRAAGSQVEEVVAYRTVAPADLSQKLAEVLPSGEDLVCFSSPSAVWSFKKALSEAGLSNWKGFVAVQGPTTLQAARQAGLDVAVEALDGSTTALVETVKQWWTRQGGQHGYGP